MIGTGLVGSIAGGFGSEMVGVAESPIESEAPAIEPEPGGTPVFGIPGIVDAIPGIIGVIPGVVGVIPGIDGIPAGCAVGIAAGYEASAGPVGA